MKIGIVLSKPPSYSETFFNSKIKGLKQSGFNVILFVQQSDPLFRLCEVRSAPKAYPKNVALQSIMVLGVLLKLMIRPARLLEFIKLERISNRSFTQILKNTYNNAHLLRADLDWLHFGFATMAVQSENVAKSINAKMAVSLRGFDIDVYPLKHKNCYDLLWKNVIQVHALSDYLLKQAYDLGLASSTKAFIIPPAVDVASLPSRQRQERSSTHIITVGRLHWIKGFHYILQALAQLDHRDFKYSIVGDGPEYAELKYSIYDLGLSENVVLLGRLTHEQTLVEMAKAHLYIQYSISEGFCNAVLEAQALGLLCIVSDGGGLPENIIHGVTGWVVPKRNPKQLAKVIEDVINLQDSDKDRISSNAINRVKEKFRLDKQRSAFKTFYE